MTDEAVALARRLKPCEQCDGDGWYEAGDCSQCGGTHRRDCGHCGGNGSAATAPDIAAIRAALAAKEAETVERCIVACEKLAQELEERAGYGAGFIAATAAARLRDLPSGQPRQEG